MTCSDCAKPLSAQNTTGRCRVHALQHALKDPAVEARRVANSTATKRTPKMRAFFAEVARRTGARPEIRELRRIRGREICARTIHSEKGRAASFSPESIAKRSATLRARARAWCPEGYYEEYQRLVRGHGYSAAEARALVLETAAADKARAEAQLTPFERQMQAVRNGAGIVERQTIPTKAYDFTLAGGSPL